MYGYATPQSTYLPENVMIPFLSENIEETHSTTTSQYNSTSIRIERKRFRCAGGESNVL
jgi:hypothetical protein